MRLIPAIILWIFIFALIAEFIFCGEAFIILLIFAIFFIIGIYGKIKKNIRDALKIIMN